MKIVNWEKVVRQLDKSWSRNNLRQGHYRQQLWLSGVCGMGKFLEAIYEDHEMSYAEIVCLPTEKFKRWAEQEIKERGLTMSDNHDEVRGWADSQAQSDAAKYKSMYRKLHGRVMPNVDLVRQRELESIPEANIVRVIVTNHKAGTRRIYEKSTTTIPAMAH